MREPSVIAASWRELFFVVWLGAGGVDVLRAVSGHQKALSRRLGGRKIAVLTVIPSTSIKMPDAETRAFVDARRSELAALMKAEAVVLLTSGFTTAMIRSIIAGIMLLQRPGHPAKVLDELEEAFKWMAWRLEPEEGQRLTPGDLAAAYAALGVPERR
jgi:hypothetical protein